MNTETPKVREGNTIMELVAFACIEEIEISEAGEAAHAAIKKFTDAWHGELDYDTNRAFDNALYGLYLLYAEEMFKCGWKLRGDPNLLAELIQPD